MRMCARDGCPALCADRRNLIFLAVVEAALESKERQKHFMVCLKCSVSQHELPIRSLQNASVAGDSLPL